MVVIFCLIYAVGTSALENDYLYFFNYIYHHNEELCQHVQPEAQFLVFVNNDTSRLLIENVPRWSKSQDENISGKGYFGVELGHFYDPPVLAGDTIHVVFTCTVREQQAEATDVVTSIPWQRWPLHLVMHPKDVAKHPADFALEIENNSRKFSWTPQAGVEFDVYRCQYDVTGENGHPTVMYERIATQRVQNHFIDSTQYGRRHGYILLAREGDILGSHSQPLYDFPAPIQDVQTAVSNGDQTVLTVSWSHEQQNDLFFRVYRDSISQTTLLQETPAPFFQQPVQLFQDYCFQIVAVNSIGNHSRPENVNVYTDLPLTDKTDLDVLFISRSPKFPRYQVAYDPAGYNPYVIPENSNQRHYPREGEDMTYTAFIQNKGSAVVSSFDVKWYVDSLLVLSEYHADLQPGQKFNSSLQWPWSVDPCLVTCSVETSDPQVSRKNDSVSIRSDALSFHFHVEENIIELFENHKNPMGSYSFEDWGRYHLDYLNHFIKRADTPRSDILRFESVFLDTVSYYQNNSLYKGGTHAPEDLLWDGRWGFTGDDNTIDYFENTVIKQQDGMDWALLHELGHQLGLVDLYNQDVHLQQVNVIEPRTGEKISLTPVAWEVVYYSSRHDALMHSNFAAGLSDHSAGALARNLGKRRGFFGEYLADIPKENSLHVVDSSGNAVKHADVWVYQKQDNQIANTVKFKGKTDAEGKFHFPHRAEPQYKVDFYAVNPFSTEFSEAPNVVGTNSTLLIRIALPQKVAYEFMDICDFNVAYWQGDSLTAEYRLEVDKWQHIPQNPAAVKSNSTLDFALQQNFPNPFNNSTTIAFSLQEPGRTSLTLFNTNGQTVFTIFDRAMNAGHHNITIKPDLPTAVYFIQLQNGSRSQWRKLVLLR